MILNLFTVSSRIDSVTVAENDDATILVSLKDDDSEMISFHGDSWNLEHWASQYGVSVKIDTIELDMINKIVKTWNWAYA